AGDEVEEQVLEAGLRRHEDGRVAVDGQILRVDGEGDHADAVLELHVGDLADLHSRHTDRLALARHHRLGRLELRLQLEGLRLEDRDAQALLLDDDDRRDQSHHDQHGDRDEIAEVLADRGGHLPAPMELSLLISVFSAGWDLTWYCSQPSAAFFSKAVAWAFLPWAAN